LDEVVAFFLMYDLEAKANLRIKDAAVDLTMGGESGVFWLYDHVNRYHVHTNIFGMLLVC
jgi:hypothetical protein